MRDATSVRGGCGHGVAPHKTRRAGMGRGVVGSSNRLPVAGNASLDHGGGRHVEWRRRRVGNNNRLSPTTHLTGRAIYEYVRDSRGVVVHACEIVGSGYGPECQPPPSSRPHGPQ